jgi:pseudouridine-5'-phosphate glycosidase
VNDALSIDPEVRAVIERKGPVVALETTVISHGLPHPENLETARELEAAVRGLGAMPATIGVLAGRIRVGLGDPELERFATGTGIHKLSSADLAYAVATGADGATTVAATIVCAEMAGIEVVATGGIGGVHRGAETTYDVSADLVQLAKTPVTVVCSGAKAILDLPKTLEMLETLGVTLITYRSDDFPAFWSRSSGIPSPLRTESVDQLARIVRTKRSLGLRSGIIVANPASEADEIPLSAITAHIEAATKEAQTRKISGKALTPFLLDRIATSTSGRSLATNIALLRANARLAALLALALSEKR